MLERLQSLLGPSSGLPPEEERQEERREAVGRIVTIHHFVPEEDREHLYEIELVGGTTHKLPAWCFKKTYEAGRQTVIESGPGRGDIVRARQDEENHSLVRDKDSVVVQRPEYLAQEPPERAVEVFRATHQLAPQRAAQWASSWVEIRHIQQFDPKFIQELLSSSLPELRQLGVRASRWVSQQSRGGK